MEKIQVSSTYLDFGTDFVVTVKLADGTKISARTLEGATNIKAADALHGVANWLAKQPDTQLTKE